MRIATWNVNSLPARLEKVSWWLERVRPDVLFLQETKVTDDDAPFEELARHGYQLAHHGEGRWNGVAIASLHRISDVVVNFGVPLKPALTTDAGDDEPFAEARMIAASVGGVRVVSIYAPNGRALGSPFYAAKLAWFERLLRWCREAGNSAEALVIGGDFNVAPSDLDVWDATACHGGTHVSAAEREAVQQLQHWGLKDAFRVLHPELKRFTWWDYRAGAFHKNLGMRIDHFLISDSVAQRLVSIDVDREARKGKPTPSDHAPLVMDLDAPGTPFDAGWGAPKS
ncbi:MAG: Exodeoxyribonuclease [Polyangiaceae bacterium]|jgi:exodeoxyribonuclease-3|nr:Exodeoxyribonuclease [Polyangiaceae bacterium]